MTAAAQYLLYLLAIVLPWGFYLDLPQYLIVPSSLLVLALLALFFVDAIRRGWRVPFELTLPLALFILVMLWGTSAAFWLGPRDTFGAISPEALSLGNLLYHFQSLVWPLLMMAVLHFSPRREGARAALNLYAASLAAWAAVMLLSEVLPLFITPFSMGVQKWNPLGSVVYMLPIVLFAAWKGERPGRSVWVGAAAVLGAMLLLVLMPEAVLPRIKQVPDFDLSYFSWLMLGIKLLVLWPVARIAAKIEVIRRGSDDKSAAIILQVLLAAIAIDVMRYAGFSLHAAFLVALAGAWALPQREPVAYKPDWKLALVAGPLTIVLVFNLLHVNSANYWDARNYTSFIKTALEAFPDSTMPASELETLNQIEERFPQETQTNYWLAYDRLMRGELYAAAVEYRKANAPPLPNGNRPILPPPSEDQRRLFMDKLRDKTSALPPADHRGAYVLALVTQDRFDEALALMRRDAAAVADVPAVDDAARQVLVEAIAVYLYGWRSADGYLKDWTTPDLLALLVAWGAEVKAAPDGMDKACLPVVLLVQPDLCKVPPELLAQEGVEAYCVAGETAIALAKCKVTIEPDQVPAVRKDGAPAVVIWLAGVGS